MKIKFKTIGFIFMFLLLSGCAQESKEINNIGTIKYDNTDKTLTAKEILGISVTGRLRDVVSIRVKQLSLLQEYKEVTDEIKSINSANCQCVIYEVNAINGNEQIIEVQEKLQIEAYIPSQLVTENNSRYKVYYVDNNRKISEMNTYVRDGKINFNTSRLGIYVFVKC